MGEDSLVRRLIGRLKNSRRGDLVLGAGDDCAVIDIGLEDDYQLLKTDSLVEGVHYREDTPADKVGWKAVARVISDFAAMGGRAGHLLVTIAMPGEKEVHYVEELYRGMLECAEAYDAIICGGETSSVPEGAAAVISVAGTGWVKKNQYVSRSGGEVGDRIFVTGRLGGSIRGKHLDFLPRIEEAKWLVEGFELTAMMDLSDGLARDLPRLAEASECGYQLDKENIPRNEGCDLSSAMGDGEDYELLFTIAPSSADQLRHLWADKFPDLELTDVGALVEVSQSNEMGKGGWQHFDR